MYEFSEEIWRSKYRWKGTDYISGTVPRVAKECAKIEKDKTKRAPIAKEFIEIMSSGIFYPAGRILYTFGTDRYGTSLNCFVIKKPKDDIKDIFRAVEDASYVAKAGGGNGFNISNLRPNNAPLSGGGNASGPVSFLKIFNVASKTILIGSRRAASIAVLNVDHPDIFDWIKSKRVEGDLNHFNISIGVTDDYVKALKNDGDWNLTHNGKVYKTIKAREIFNAFCESAWKYNDPGIFHIGNVNRLGPGNYIEHIEAPNPCITGDSIVETTEGRKTIEEMANANQQFEVYSVNRLTGDLEIKTGYNILKTKTVNKYVKLTLSNGQVLKCTHDHEVYCTIKDRTNISTDKNVHAYTFTNANKNSIYKVSAGDLLELWVGPSIDWRHNVKPIVLQRTKASEKYLRVKMSTQTQYTREHRLIAKHYYDDLADCDDVHHNDGNTFNNIYTNLKVLTHSRHSIVTNQGHLDWADRDACTGQFEKKTIQLKKSSVPAPVELLTNNGTAVVSYTKIEEVEESVDVYDMTVVDNHNFIANGMCISNCGEQPLFENTACCLGAINLAGLVKNPFTDTASFNIEALEKVVRTSIRFLDNVLDITSYPIPDMKTMVHDTRRVGLGVMGLADTLAMMKIKYGSDESIELINTIWGIMRFNAYIASAQLGKEKGSFKRFDKTKHFECEYFNSFPRDELQEIMKIGALRNVCTLTCAPTGTTAILAGNVSSGIEPIFSKSYTRKVLDHKKNESVARKVEDYAWRMYNAIGKPDGPDPDYFIEAQSVPWEKHVLVQETIQKYVDNAISKTINMPSDTPLDKYKELMMHVITESNLKGITTYVARGDRESILSTDDVEATKGERIELFPSTLKRPVECSGSTYKIPYSPDSSLYVTINSNNEIKKKLFEVFIECKNGKGKPWDAVTSRILSALFRRLPDKELEFLISELKEIKDPDAGVWFGANYVHSASHAVAIAIEMFLGRKDDSSSLDKLSTDELAMLEQCPDCHERGVMPTETCKKCMLCGWTECT